MGQEELLDVLRHILTKNATIRKRDALVFYLVLIVLLTLTAELAGYLMSIGYTLVGLPSSGCETVPNYIDITV